jgi:hypothetical protein
METVDRGHRPHAMRAGWPPHRTLSIWLLLGGVLRDATGAWSAAVFLDAGLIACAVLLLVFVRESAKSRVLNRERAPDTERRLGPRVQPSRRTAV